MLLTVRERFFRIFFTLNVLCVNVKFQSNVYKYKSLFIYLMKISLNFTLYVSTNIAYLIGLRTHLIIVYFHEIVFISSYTDHIKIFINYLLIFWDKFSGFYVVENMYL